MLHRFRLHLDESYLETLGKSAGFELSYLDRETFFITKYINKHLRKKRLNSENTAYGNIKQLIIFLASSENNIYLGDPDTLCCDLTAKYTDVFTLRGEARVEKFIEMIVQSVALISTLEPTFAEEIQNAVEQFRQENYKNIWVHKKKRITGVGVAKLECDLSALDFYLSLVVENKKEEVFRKIILNTAGDSFAYHHLFNNVELHDDKFSILDRIFSKPIYTISLAEIQNNGTGVFPLTDNINETMKLDNELGYLVEDLKLHPRKTKWWDDFKQSYRDYKSTEPCPNPETIGLQKI